MPKDQLLIGAVFALFCLIGLYKDLWILAQTKKGQWLVRRCGQQRSVWLLRSLFGCGAVFGVLLACNVIRPVQW